MLSHERYEWMQSLPRDAVKEEGFDHICHGSLVVNLCGSSGFGTMVVLIRSYTSRNLRMMPMCFS